MAKKPAKPRMRQFAGVWGKTEESLKIKGNWLA
jgi:hypothetical protein